MRKLLLNLHLYCALIVGIFVIIVGLSGSVIAFEPELDALMNPHLFRIAPQADRQPVAGLFQAASRAFPGQKIGNLRLPQSADETVQFNIKGPRQVFMNPYTGAIVGERDPKTVLAKIHQIHQRLLIGAGASKRGDNIVAFITGILIFLVLSGVYLWWPLKRAKIKWSASARRVHFDLHNTVGIYSALFLFVLGVTGLAVRFDDDIEQYLHRTAGTQKIGKNVPSVAPRKGTAVTPDQAVQIALDAMPGTRVLSISRPPNPKASYLVALRFPEDLTPGGRSWVNIDQYSGKVVNEQNSRTAPIATRAIIWNRRIHTGDLLGFPTKALMSLSSLMLVSQAITGYYLWWKKLRARQRQTELAAKSTLV